MKEYPGLDGCRRLLERYSTPRHVIRHSMLVARVAVFIGKKLKEKGVDVDIGLLLSAGLLHDILKILDFKDLEMGYFDDSDRSGERIRRWERQRRDYRGLQHEEAAHGLFKERYPRLAGAIIRHRYSALGDLSKDWTIEDKILTYADKRVMHDQIVSLKERFIDGHQRYGVPFDELNMTELEKAYFRLEAELLGLAGIRPGDIADAMRRDKTPREVTEIGQGLL